MSRRGQEALRLRAHGYIHVILRYVNSEGGIQLTPMITMCSEGLPGVGLTGCSSVTLLADTTNLQGVGHGSAAPPTGGAASLAVKLMSR